VKAEEAEKVAAEQRRLQREQDRREAEEGAAEGDAAEPAALAEVEASGDEGAETISEETPALEALDEVLEAALEPSGDAALEQSGGNGGDEDPARHPATTPDGGEIVANE
jgi:hypothetical protein